MRGAGCTKPGCPESVIVSGWCASGGAPYLVPLVMLKTLHNKMTQKTEIANSSALPSGTGTPSGPQGQARYGDLRRRGCGEGWQGSTTAVRPRQLIARELRARLAAAAARARTRCRKRGAAG